ncbi:uncharacterized protein znf654 [Megalops cyprinoides]|uniref:uncharacterized protein znf654 n=1 Tax=Megalops cyprinoides TaxID=118141 RepID=UPI0018644D0B|nr:uncharacterized protein znf654 [Megalops cyprinoides]
MAEEESDLESERFKEQLGSLLDCGSGDDCGSQSKNYCTRFCVLVEEQTGRWQVPLPQLQVLRTALCYFARDTVTFPSDCEHVRYALSSLALSFFELLLFFGKDEFLEDPLKDILESFQECHSCLVRHKNVYLLLLKQIIKDGGPWEHPVLQAILRETAPSREEVERYLNSEVPVFFELRVRYLLACERIPEAMALSKSCIEHPDVGRHLYFHQAYLTCLWKASLYDHLHKEMAEIDGRDAVEIICNTESEERDDLLLALCKAFLTQQLQNGDMYYIWDLIFIWSKLHLRANPSKQDFLEECHQLMLSATNVKSIFPFMKVIRAELGNEGLQFCVELCARALQMDLHHDPVTKSLIYKTIAFLLPNDLEVCRACALLVFFLERTVESYKTVYLLYTHPDQEYHVDYSLVKNHIRFEILQILKKGLFFDPEFWNLITLRTNCLKLMSEKVMQAALNEIMEEDKWIPNYCVKEPPKFYSDIPDCYTNRVRRHPVRDSNKPVRKCIVVPPEGGVVPLVKKRGRKPGSRVIRVIDDSQLRRSFRQLDMAQENSIRQHDNRQQRLMARQVEKKTLKRRGRKPRWLLQEAARQAENSAPRRIGRPGRKKQLPPKMETKQPDHGTVEMNETDKAQDISIEEPGGDSELTPQSPAAETANEETVHLQEKAPTSQDTSVLHSPLLTPVPVTMLEVSVPDNVVMGSFSEDREVETLVDVALQASTAERGVSVGEVSVKDPSAESSSEYVLPSETPDHAVLCAPQLRVMTESGEESVVEVDNDIIQQLHNYSRIPEEVSEENVQPSATVPEESPTAQQESLCESAETVRQETETGELCETAVAEEAMPSQTPAGVGLLTEVDISEAERRPEAVVEGTEEVSQERAYLAEDSCVTLDVNVPGDISVPDDHIVIPHDVTSALQNITSTPDNSVTTCTENTESITDVLDKTVVDNTSVSDETAASDITDAPSNVIGALNDTVAHIVPTPPSEKDQGLTSALVHTKDMESEKDPSEPAPDVLAKKVNSVLKHRCKLCNKEFKGGNIMRHAISHLQKATLQCMFCGKVFNRRLIAKRHVEEHVEKLRSEHGPDPSVAPENGTSETLECVRQSLSRNAKHKKRSTAKYSADTEIPVNNRKFNKLKGLEKLEEVKDSNSLKDKGTALKANGSIVEGDLERRKEEYCCPADGCKRKFVRRGMAMIRHALKSHPKDIKVQEFAFHWRKGKCEFCQRRFWSFLHYQDHIKRHDHPLKHVCLHLECKNRFKTKAELRDHMKTHQPLRAQCSFADCSQIFGRVSQLQDHEWRHYPVSDTMEDSLKTRRKVGRPAGRKRKDFQDASGHSHTVLKESEKLHSAVPDVSDANKSATNTTEMKGGNKDMAETNALEKPVQPEVLRSAGGSGFDRQIVNGHGENVLTQTETGPVYTQDIGQETRVEVKSVDKKIDPKASNQNPAVQECKRLKEVERSTYGGTSNRPFVRPPPSAYLDERYISMPKRRKSSPVDTRSPAEQSNFSREAQRQRCSKCFSTFNSAEELQSHLSLNKCTSLFGFDSDEESAW